MNQQQMSETHGEAPVSEEKPMSYEIYIGKVDNYIIETVENPGSYEIDEDGILEILDEDDNLVFWAPATNVLYMRNLSE